MSTFLVTGGAGFIGSHLCDALVARGDTVRVLDDLSTGRRSNLPASAILIEGDVADAAAVYKAMDGVDGCFHLAAIASVERGITEWVGANQANMTGTITVFDAIRRQGSRIPVVYASSAAVYGDVAVVPTTEAEPCRPLSAYGADKYGCELHARVAAHVYGIPTVGFRFFNVYGSRQDPKSPYSGVISIFCERIASGRPIAIFGDGHQTRDFVYIADVVRALLAGMALRPRNSPVFNVCGGIPTSIEELAHLIADLAGKKLAARRHPPRAGEIRHSLGVPSLADAVLGIGGRVPLRVGLSNVLTWMRESVGWPSCEKCPDNPGDAADRLDGADFCRPAYAARVAPGGSPADVGCVDRADPVRDAGGLRQSAAAARVRIADDAAGRPPTAGHRRSGGGGHPGT
ncbi:MAG TPA: NAD-dependent epimerase/dehydratase family protein [Rhodopila sp.]